ncbi:efflux RND transporter periplasmic adaptor subunit [Hahella sp. KA22]|uniref:efflux RND transporter periplasmic adaptor subunit n=1 Tax=Hahella sp. KA22 TaxID=1628392 RepID=UPI000FDED604|nr:efflux RND transporter periplasmic adaptor subunit [Hahella sp. KA22]AZZ92363.1 efflux RND transporter periplasmic adaptor subunit [Hahella sp. KA22]QAY55736.1 efflux RND transporter periplasmic adaptor subunit [Hahella sp. KA22]
MLKKLLWVFAGLVVVALIVGGIIQVKMQQFDTMGAAAAQMTMPPTPVNTYTVEQSQWRPRVSLVGSVKPVQGTVINTEIDGTVKEIKFSAGADVKAGDVLVLFDDQIERAELREAEVAAERAQLSLTRAKELSKTRNISQLEFDNAENDVKQAQARLNYNRAVIAKKTLRAPFDGKLGIRQISVGQFLDRGTPVVSLQALNPVYVEFSLSQRRLGELAEGLKVEVVTDAYPDQKFVGKITAFNPDVDPNTRNVRVQATLDNPEGKLRPGMFVAIDMILAQTRDVLFIPSTAVLHGPYGSSVYIVDEGEAKDGGDAPLVLRQQLVRLGETQGDFVIVVEGVKPGDRVVSTGSFKLMPGMSVLIDNKMAPDFKLNPQPKNT